MTIKDHEMSYTNAGNGNMGTMTPNCSCGWKGSPQYNYNDDQYTSARRQWEHHKREAFRPSQVSASADQAS
jgi:hypothetical protein